MPRRADKQQLALDLRPRRRDGKPRKQPGRKPTGTRRDPRHRTRPAVVARHPVHVVLRTTHGVGGLRRRRAYHAVRGALTRAAARSDYRVVHVSIQRHHLHLLVEADDKRALARGMQGFAISAAKRLNRALHRARGPVFAFRYHATAITTPAQARNALAYVLNNWRRHREDRFSTTRTDPFATAYAFPDWHVARDRHALPVAAPTAWLLITGWRRARAGPIRATEVPGPDPTPMLDA
jgi:REP element-mobilizing transposase RayT